MSTFIDPVKVRHLAASGDNFWKGAAWVLDQQDAARIDPADYESEWKPARNGAFGAYLETSAALARHDRANEAVAASLAALLAERSEYATVQETRDRLRARREADMYRPINNAADLGAPRVP